MKTQHTKIYSIQQRLRGKQPALSAYIKICMKFTLMNKNKQKSKQQI